MPEPLLQIVDLDLPEAAVYAFSAWYAGRHAPDLHHCGYETVTSYRVIEGDMALLDLAQVPDFATFEGDGYRALSGRDPYLAEVGSATTNSSTALYGYAAEGPLPVAEASQRLDADWITMVRFDGTDAVSARIGEWLREAGRAPLEAAGAGAIRLLTAGPPHPVRSSKRPGAGLLIAWQQPPPTSEEVLALLAPALGDLEVALTTGIRLYPWPNTRSLRD